MIKIEGIKFSYGNKEILKNINLEIKKGKMIGILGPNGCGKSTLLKNILGYLKPSSGNIFINNKKTDSISSKELAKLVSLVPQKSSLMSPMTVEDFVLMGRLPHLTSSWSGYRGEDFKIVKDKLNFLELNKFEKRVALSLSGGEFQRVLLARALVQDTELLLLDEPTSALDLNHAVEILNSVKMLVSNHGITGVAVLHDLNLASMFCDEIIMMKDGEIYYQGTPQEVIKEEILKEIYNLKSRVFCGENNIPYVIPQI